MAPGFDQICMSRPRIIYLDLALPVPGLSSLLRRGASRRGWIRVEGAFGIIGGSRRVREDRGKTESSNGRRTREEGKRRWARTGGMCHGIRGNINTAGLSNEPECDLRIFQRAGGLA